MPKIGCAAALCQHPKVEIIRYIRIPDIEKFLTRLNFLKPGLFYQSPEIF